MDHGNVDVFSGLCSDVLIELVIGVACELHVIIMNIIASKHCRLLFLFVKCNNIALFFIQGYVTINMCLFNFIGMCHIIKVYLFDGCHVNVCFYKT